MADYILEALLFPPTGPLVLVVLGLVAIAFNRKKSGLLLALIGVSLQVSASLPVVAFALADPLQSRYPVLDLVPESAQAIVVLGGGSKIHAPEYGQRATVKARTLERLRYAAYLHRISGLPILTAGGAIGFEAPAEAVVMKRELERELGVPVRWTEDRSHNTYDNATHAARILSEAGIERVVLVTHALHMPRALWCFEQVGLQATPAPTAFMGRPREYPYVPNYRSLERTGVALHEWVGLVWYRLRYGFIPTYSPWHSQ